MKRRLRGVIWRSPGFTLSGLGMALVVAAVWTSGFSIGVKILSSLAAVTFGLGLIASFNRLGRAVGRASKRQTAFERGQQRKMSQLSSTAIQGLKATQELAHDVANVVNVTERSGATLGNVVRNQRRSGTPAVPGEGSRTSGRALGAGAPAETGVRPDLGRPTFAARGTFARFGSDWAVERELALPGTSALAPGALHPVILANVSRSLGARISSCAELVDSPESLAAPLDFLVVSDVAVGEGTSEPRQCAEAMVSWTEQATGFSGDVPRVAWLESEAFGTREVLYLASNFDVVIVTQPEHITLARNTLFCRHVVGVSELAGLMASTDPDVRSNKRAALTAYESSIADLDAGHGDGNLLGRVAGVIVRRVSDGLIGIECRFSPFGEMRANGVWTPSFIISALFSRCCEGRKRPMSQLTIISPVANMEEAGSAAARFDALPRATFPRHLMVVSSRVPKEEVMRFMRAHAGTDTVVTCESLLSSAEGRTGLTSTWYSVIAPPGTEVDPLDAEFAALVAELSPLPIALALRGTGPTLIDPWEISRLAESRYAIRSVVSSDGKTPAATMEAR